MLVLSVLLATSACSEKLTPAGERVKTSMEKPEGHYELVGVIHAFDGEGCGLLGTSGSFEAAQAKLRNEAATKGATYIHITKVQTPVSTGSCAAHRYDITGVAYRPSSSEMPSEP